MIHIDDSKLTKEQLAVLNTMKAAFLSKEEVIKRIPSKVEVKPCPELELILTDLQEAIKRALVRKAIRDLNGVWPLYNERYIYLDKGVWNFNGTGPSVYYKDFGAALNEKGVKLTYADR